MEVPEMLKEFYEKFEYRSQDSKVKLVAHCKKCSKAITANWNYPKLFQLHLHHHVIPATSAAIERGFSVAVLICSDRRKT